jgi:hypothetical protein
MLKRSVVTATAVATSNSAESLVATLPPAPLPNDPSSLLVAHTLIDGFLNFTAGASTTAVVLRVRRNSIAGALVGPVQTHTLAGGTIGSIAFSADDPASANPNESQVYVVTIQQTAGTAPGATNYAVITVTIS